MQYVLVVYAPRERSAGHTVNDTSVVGPYSSETAALLAAVDIMLKAFMSDPAVIEVANTLDKNSSIDSVCDLIDEIEGYVTAFEKRVPLMEFFMEACTNEEGEVNGMLPRARNIPIPDMRRAYDLLRDYMFWVGNDSDEWEHWIRMALVREVEQPCITPFVLSQRSGSWMWEPQHFPTLEEARTYHNRCLKSGTLITHAEVVDSRTEKIVFVYYK